MLFPRDPPRKDAHLSPGSPEPGLLGVADISMLVPYFGLVVFISSILTAVSMHAGTDLLCALLGREKCVSTDGLNGCNWWPLSVLASSGACWLLWTLYGWHGLTGAIAGPLLSIILAALLLRFGHLRYRKKGFVLTGEGIVDHRSGQVLKPEYIITTSSYECTGPASGYCLYSIVLKNSDGVMASNGYVNELTYEPDRHGLIFEQRVPTLSVCFFKETAGEFKSVTLGRGWNDLIFPSNSHLPTECRNWWKRFATPQLGKSDVVNVEEALLRKNMAIVQESLEKAGRDRGAMEPEDFPGSEGEDPYNRIKLDILGLERLLSISEGRLKALNHEYMSEHMEQVWGKAYPTMSRVEEYLWVTEPYKEDMKKHSYNEE